jgi:hypothetical protein
MKLSGFAKIALLLAVACLALYAQSDLGTINGFVRDATGSTVPNATVTVRNEATGVERRATTNDAGLFVVTNIPAGLYTVSVEAKGFKKYEVAHNKLDPNATTAVDAALTIGAATETVEVTATAQQLQSESASVQQLITRTQIDMMELNGRNPVGLAGLVPGARGGTAANLNFGLSQGPSNFNGSRNPENLITLDGAPATRTRSNGAAIGAADVDSTQEVQILTANYNPEYGRTSGAQIRITTRTGGKEFHGAAYEYFRNDALNANSWSRNGNPLTAFAQPQRYNQFGFNIGGPIYIPGKFNKDRNKIFGYYGEEWLKYRFAESGTSVGSAGLLTVPSLKMRQGDFSELLAPNIFYNAANTPKIVKDPVTGQPFPNNVIPKDRLSPNGLGILNAWPVPNLTTPIGGNGNWFTAATHTYDQRKDTIAADFNLTDTQRVAFRRQNYSYLEYQPLDGNTDRTPKFFNRPNQTNSVDYVWTVGPRLINEALATVSLDNVYIPVDSAHFFDRTKAGLNYPYIFPDGKLIPTRIPTVNMSPFSGLSGGPYPSHSTGPIYNVSDSITWIKGNHTFKFGFLYERSGENDNDEINVQACPTCTNNQNGQFLFTDGRAGGTGVAPANAALGLFDTYSEIGHRAYTIFRGSMYEGFAQDAWKVTQKLHVDYGVRYSVIVPYSALWRNMIVFDPKYYDPAKAVKVDPTTGRIVPGTGDPFNGMVIPGSSFPDSAKGRFPEADSGQFNYLFRGGAESSYYSKIHWGQFQPRVGIAYQLTPKTVLRAGGGRFFTRLGVSDSVFLGGNPPFQPNASVTNGSVDNPGAGGAASIPLVVTTQSKEFKNPEAWNWNFTLERELPGNSVVSVAYVGRRGLHLQREADINQPTTATVAPFLKADGSLSVNLDSLRPYQGFGSIRQTDNVASSRYNSFQLSWNRRYSKGLLFGLSYTLSKSSDDGSNQRDVIPNTYDAHNLWGPSEFDARHILVINGLYDLPFFRNQTNVAGRLIGGWQVSAVAQFQTGTPCGAAEGRDYAGVGLDSNFGCGVNGQYWIVNGDPKIVGQFAAGGTQDPSQWFATKNPDGSPIFTRPTFGTFNQAQNVRNLIYQPGFQNWNLGLFKKFAFNERTGLQFRAEAFNAFNHPNWGGASGGGVQFNPTNGAFGKVTTKGSERNMQLSLRFYF